jgi:hypothetical protein
MSEHNDEWPLDPYTGAPPSSDDDPKVFAAQLEVGRDIAKIMAKNSVPLSSQSVSSHRERHNLSCGRAGSTERSATPGFVGSSVVKLDHPCSHRGDLGEVAGNRATLGNDCSAFGCVMGRPSRSRMTYRSPRRQQATIPVSSAVRRGKGQSCDACRRSPCARDSELLAGVGLDQQHGDMLVELVDLFCESVGFWWDRRKGGGSHDKQHVTRVDSCYLTPVPSDASAHLEMRRLGRK